MAMGDNTFMHLKFVWVSNFVVVISVVALTTGYFVKCVS